MSNRIERFSTEQRAQSNGLPSSKRGSDVVIQEKPDSVVAVDQALTQAKTLIKQGPVVAIGVAAIAGVLLGILIKRK